MKGVINMNEKDLKKLSVFKNTEKDVPYKDLNEIHETDTYYVASDEFRAAMLFKDDNNHYVSKTYNNVLENIAKMMADDLETNEIKFVINRKNMIKTLREIWTESQKINRIYKKIDRIIKININYDKYILDLESDGIHKKVNFTVDKFYSCYKDFTRIGFKYQYLLDFLNYFDSDSLTLQFSSSVTPVVCENENKVSMLLPVRLREE
jgi:DNA polymerase III sliding clamp (beta) subunit (PCNA family)